MRKARAFTLIEMLVVLAVVGLLLSLVAPRFAHQVDRSREVVLKQNLSGLREAIDRFYADRGRYPKDLPELVALRYLRAVPVDPITERSDTWKPVPPPGQGETVFDVRSGAPGIARDGSPYASW